MPRTVHLEGTRTVHLTGTEHHEKALRKIVKRNREVDARVPFDATLMPDPRSPDVITVKVNRKTVGHFPHDEAAKYRDALDALSDATITVDGLIYAGHHGGFSWSVGVRMPRPNRMPD